jgi:hypothetical protein
MQLITTLAFTPAIEMPTANHVACWVRQHPGLGATKRLRWLGFKADTEQEIKSSFLCFHNVLAGSLSLDNRVLYGYHAPFSEQILCGVQPIDQYVITDQRKPGS